MVLFPGNRAFLDFLEILRAVNSTPWGSRKHKEQSFPYPKRTEARHSHKSQVHVALAMPASASPV